MNTVTVVVPTIGERPALLAQTLGSIARQEGVQPFEVVVVDASGTGRVASESSLPESVRLVVSTERLTAGQARCLGSHVSSTEWIAYCDDDDLWSPRKLFEQFNALRSSPAGWCVSGAVSFCDAGTLLSAKTIGNVEDVLKGLNVGNPIPGGGSAFIVRRSLLNAVGGWDTELVEAEDWDLFIRLAQASPLMYVHEPLVAYRIHGNAKSPDLSRTIQAFERLALKHGWSASTEPPLDWIVRRELLLGEQERVRNVFAALPVRSRNTRMLQTAFRLAPEATIRAYRRYRVREFPNGWAVRSKTWLTDALSSTGGEPESAE